MNRFLLDTNVVSDLAKGDRANLGVRQWLQGLFELQVFISVITIGEIEKALVIAEHKGLDVRRQRHLLEFHLPQKFAGRILSFDPACAALWGKLLGRLQGDKISERALALDAQIAAIAQEHHMSICTRDAHDFERLGAASIINPFA